MSLFQKKFRVESAHLKNYNYSDEGSYYVTICLQKKQNLFGTIVKQKILLSEIGIIVADVWRNLPEMFKNIWLGEFVFMPDHMHGIVNIKKKTNRTLHAMIGAFKSKSTIAVNKHMGTLGAKLWQASYFDRIIRGDKEYFFVSEYILNNPVVYGQKNADKEWYELMEERNAVEKGLALSQGGKQE